MKKDVRENARALKRLNIAAEKAKKTLSASTTTTIEVESLLDGVDYNTSLTRAKFEQLADKVFSRTLEPLDRLLKDAKMSKGDIHEIGSLRVNSFYEYRDKYLNDFKLEPESNSNIFTVLLIGTGPANHDLNLIECVLECFKGENLSEFQLIYRPHPFSQLSNLDLDKIRKIHSVKIDMPHQAEINDHRLNLIIKSNAVVSLYSTVLLEASILNKLCIIPSFIVRDTGYNTSHFLDDSPHYSGLSTLGNIYCADTENDFLNILKGPGEKSGEPVSSNLLNWFCKNLNSANEIVNEVLNLHKRSE
jgi:hypothetical protein